MNEPSTADLTDQSSSAIESPAGGGFHADARLAICIVTLLIAAVAIFARLGHYPLWDDEANTALIAEGVWHTGDTSAVVGKNIVAYRGGFELNENLKTRYDPPLQYFLDAPFVGLWPTSALAARIPFAAIGFLAVAMMFYWLYRENAGTLTFILTAMALVGNVSLWLFCRQCRYYGASIFFSTVVAYFYYSPDRSAGNRAAGKTRWRFLLLALASILLFATNYLSYTALYLAIGVDWLIWGRHKLRMSLRDWILLVVPQAILVTIVFLIWDPLRRPMHTEITGGLADKFHLFWWNWRDMNAFELGSLLLVILGPLLWLFRRDIRLLRWPLALLCYIVAVDAFSPQKIWVFVDGHWLQNTFAADVRYLTGALPLMIAISVLVIQLIVPRRAGWLAIVIGILAFGTNILEGGGAVSNSVSPQPLFQSPPLLFANELLSPPSDPYTVTIAWINQHVAPGQSIWILPDYMVYPLMYHAPQVVYAWQVQWPPPHGFESLPLIQFQGRELPDFVICFGPALKTLMHCGLFPTGTKADLVATIDNYWRDMFRPEMAWRTFVPITGYDVNQEAIYVIRIHPQATENFHL